MNSIIKDMSRAALYGMAFSLVYAAGNLSLLDSDIGPFVVGMFNSIERLGLTITNPELPVSNFIKAVNFLALLLLFGASTARSCVIVAPYRLIRATNRVRWIASEIMHIAIGCISYWLAYALTHIIVFVCASGRGVPLTGLDNVVHTLSIRLIPGSIVVCLWCNVLSHHFSRLIALMTMMACFVALIVMLPGLESNLSVACLNPMMIISSSWEMWFESIFPRLNYHVISAIYWMVALIGSVVCFTRYFKCCDIL